MQNFQGLLRMFTPLRIANSNHLSLQFVPGPKLEIGLDTRNKG